MYCYDLKLVMIACRVPYRLSRKEQAECLELSVCSSGREEQDESRQEQDEVLDPVVICYDLLFDSRSRLS